MKERRMARRWIKRAWTRTKESLSSIEAQAKIEKLESALELEVVGKRRADVDKTAAETISGLIDAIKDTEEAVLRVGSIIVVKNNGRVWAEKIDELTARQLELDPMILQRPEQVTQFFEENHRRRARTLHPVQESEIDIAEIGRKEERDNH